MGEARRKEEYIETLEKKIEILKKDVQYFKKKLDEINPTQRLFLSGVICTIIGYTFGVNVEELILVLEGFIYE